MENHHFHGKIHYFYGHFQYCSFLYVHQRVLHPAFIRGFPSLQGRDRHGLACGAASFAELAPKSTGGADD